MKNEKCFLQMTNLFPVDDEIPTAVNDLFLANEKKVAKYRRKRCSYATEFQKNTQPGTDLLRNHNCQNTIIRCPEVNITPFEVFKVDSER